MPEPDPVALAVEATTTSAIEPTLDQPVEPTLDQPVEPTRDWSAEPVLDVAAEPLVETAPARTAAMAWPEPAAVEMTLAEPAPVEMTLPGPAPVEMTLAERVLAEMALTDPVLVDLITADPAPVDVLTADPAPVDVLTADLAPVELVPAERVRVSRVAEPRTADLVLFDPPATIETPSPVTPAAPARSTAPGRRKATTRASIRPQRAARTEVPAVRTRGSARPSARRSAGSHASPVTRVRRSPLRRLPSVPLLIGIAALVMSAGGAITAANNGSDYGYSTRYSQASALTGVSDVTRVNLLNPRDTKVVSRDSSRETASSGADPALVNLAQDQAKDRTETLTKFAEQAQATSARIKRNLWLLPTTGYHLTARFGDVGLWQHFHTGLDFAAPAGTPIVSIADGVVTSAGYDGAYGNKTVITLNDGTEIWYCHQTSIYVNVGQAVKAGQRIGTVGYTGHTTGAHLHIEVRPGGGDPVDPYAAFIVHGVTP